MSMTATQEAFYDAIECAFTDKLYLVSELNKTLSQPITSDADARRNLMRVTEICDELMNIDWDDPDTDDSR